MRKYEIVFSEDAREDLKNIHKFIKDVSSEQNANIVTSKIVKKIRSFNIFPERNEIFAKDKNGLSIRVTISGKYRIIYIVKKQNRKVMIARIISASQDTRKTIE